MANEEIIDGIPMDLSRLPAELHGLIPLIRKWSTSDDVDRTEQWEAASTEELQALFHAVWPHMSAINAYLDEADKLTPYPDEAMALGRLAEGVCEVQFVLRERTGRDPAAG